MEKPREFWVYEGLKNLSTLIFIYRKAQPIKQTAPENFNEICVIEKSAYDQLLADARELQKALEFYRDNYGDWDSVIAENSLEDFEKKYGSAE